MRINTKATDVLSKMFDGYAKLDRDWAMTYLLAQNFVAQSEPERRIQYAVGFQQRINGQSGVHRRTDCAKRRTDVPDPRDVNDQAARVAHTDEVLTALDELLSTLKDAEAGQRGYLLTSAAHYLDPYNAAVAALPDKVRRVKRLTEDNPRQQARIPSLEKRIAEELDELTRTIALQETDFETARRIVMTDAGKKIMDAVRAQVAEMEQEERGLLLERERQSQRSYQWALATTCLSAVLSLALIGGVFYLIGQNLLARTRAAAVLHEERERFRTTLTSIGDGVSGPSPRPTQKRTETNE